MTEEIEAISPGRYCNEAYKETVAFNNHEISQQEYKNRLDKLVDQLREWFAQGN